jgi:general secretion pathway protein J
MPCSSWHLASAPGVCNAGPTEHRRARAGTAKGRPFARRCDGGFTLLELLVAIALLGLLMTVLLAGISLLTRHVALQGGHLDRAAVISVVESFLRLQLAKAAAIVPSDARDGSILFAGSGESVSFVATAPQSVPSSGLEIFAVARAGRRLVVRSAPFSGMLTGGAEPRETILLDGVSEARFRYYGVVPPEKEPRWHGAWQDMADLPRLVSVELAFADGTRMPPLLVRPRLAASAYTK